MTTNQKAKHQQIPMQINTFQMRRGADSSSLSVINHSYFKDFVFGDVPHSGGGVDLWSLNKPIIEATLPDLSWAGYTVYICVYVYTYVYTHIKWPDWRRSALSEWLVPQFLIYKFITHVVLNDYIRSLFHYLLHIQMFQCVSLKKIRLGHSNFTNRV